VSRRCGKVIAELKGTYRNEDLRLVSKHVKKTDGVESYFNGKAKTYDNYFGLLYFQVHNQITWRHIEPYLPTDPNALILDACGGTGRWSIRMARKGCRVVLLDISEKMLETAEKRIRREGLQNRIIIKREDITKTSYPDETFDMVLCELALLFFENPDILLKELNRVLKRGGRLIISAPNRYVQSLFALPEKPNPSDMENALDILLRKKYGTMPENTKVKIYTWTPDEFRKMLERNGFSVEKIVGKATTMPLRISKELFTKKGRSRSLYNKILQFELALCEQPDALALADDLQAIARKPLG
jgi:ubiquinone/menaquinone biosynthesis C-methylase UbiE